MSESGGMSTLVKVLIVVGSLFLMVGGCSVLLGSYAMKGTKAVAEEAESFAKSTDQAGCLAEAVTQMKACGDSAICLVKVSAFEAICLTESTPSPGFCEGAPKTTDSAASEAWYEARCPELGMPGDDGCHAVLGVQQGMCHDPSMKKAAAAGKAPEEAPVPKQAPAPEEAPAPE